MNEMKTPETVPKHNKMKKKTLFLVCNAHLDPVWLWRWEEGLAETLSTFRSAARLCADNEDFIFCHNESLLYQWIEAFEPSLFEEIKALVRQGRWHIVGGWYLQPDGNMPCGESFVRQILLGKRYFREKFQAEPSVGVNLDPFGHTRGLVQILKKSGYEGYLFCRPDKDNLTLPEDFIWVGYDGSEILAHRAIEHYNSEQGKAREKIQKWIAKKNDREVGIILWGIGDHGGGPAREDLKRIAELRSREKSWQIVHGKPEDYFHSLQKIRDKLPRFDGDLNPWAVGCYTTMSKVKMCHRQLESQYFSTEKMLANAALQGLIQYPASELQEALEDLLFCQFHDILPGSSIAEVESFALQKMNHSLEIITRLRAQAFYRLLAGEKPALEGEFPIFVYNPYPTDIQEIVICELQPQEPNFDPHIFLAPHLQDSERNFLPFQLEKTSCNIKVDQRKRIVFQAKLKASSMNRFSCYLKKVKSPPVIDRDSNSFIFHSDELEFKVNNKTGLVNRYCVNGSEYFRENAFQFLVLKDYPDPWGMKVRSFREVIGAFTLMTAEEAAEFAAIQHSKLRPIRIIEDGPIRTVVEALFKYHHSFLCLRYKIPKIGGEIELEARVYWLEKDKILKLSIPTPFHDGKCDGQVAYGVQEFERQGEELVAQKWVMVSSAGLKQAITVINNGTHGFDFKDGELRLSLLRSPAYAGHPVDNGISIVPDDQFEPRIDQGEHTFRFWIKAGSFEERRDNIELESQVKNDPPFALCCYPPAKGRRGVPGLTLTDSTVQLAALKFAENQDWLVMRFFEPSGENRKTRVTIPFIKVKFDLAIRGFEIKTIALDLHTKEHFEVDLLERKSPDLCEM